jgi:hypothetical protein
MRTTKTLMAVSATAIVMALSPLAGAQAAGLLSPASKLDAGALTVQVKHRHHHHAHGGPGRCGENMYWSSKHGECRDARLKT